MDQGFVHLIKIMTKLLEQKSEQNWKFEQHFGQNLIVSYYLRWNCNYNKSLNVLTNGLLTICLQRWGWRENFHLRRFQTNGWRAGGFVMIRCRRIRPVRDWIDPGKNKYLLFIYYELNRVFTNYFGISVKT